MTPSEFKEIRISLGLDEADFAGELGYNGTRRNNRFLIQQYENGIKTIPAYVARLAFMLLEHYNVEDKHLPEWPPSCAHLPRKPPGENRK